MAGDSEDADTTAGRLEAALERIARLAGNPVAGERAATTSPNTAELAARLDIMIERLRAALGDQA